MEMSDQEKSPKKQLFGFGSAPTAMPGERVAQRIGNKNAKGLMF